MVNALYVERVRDGGELVHDRLVLGCGDGPGHRLGIERVADHLPPAQSRTSCCLDSLRVMPVTVSAL